MQSIVLKQLADLYPLVFLSISFPFRDRGIGFAYVEPPKPHAMKTNLRLALWLVTLLAVSTGYAQEESYMPTQHSSLMMLNPSFAGTSICPQLGYNFLWQHNAKGIDYYTSSFVGDARIERMAGSVAAFFSVDKGKGMNYNYGGSITYVYDLEVNRHLVIKPSLSVGVRNFSTELWTLNDRYDFNYHTASLCPGISGRTGFTLGAAVLVYSEKWFAGFSASNISRPVEMKHDSIISRLPVKLTVLAGTSFGNRVHVFFPVLMYEYQGKRYQYISRGNYFLDPTHILTLNVNYRYRNLISGLGTRYIMGHDMSCYAQLGFELSNFKFTYNVGFSPYHTESGSSSVSLYNQAGLEFTFNCRPPSKRARAINCPSFGGPGITAGSSRYINTRFVGSYSGTGNQQDVSDTRNYNVKDDEEIKAGTLTAGELNDFGKWGLWKDFSKEKLSSYSKIWEINPETRYSVQVLNALGRAVVDAEVTLFSDKENAIWVSHTDNTGRAELWDGIYNEQKNENCHIVVNTGKQEYTFEGVQEFNKGMNVVHIPEDCSRPSAVDLLFLVDATSSMEDEIKYLKTELRDIIEHVSEKDKSLEMRTGCMFYQCADNNNDYLTDPSGFANDINVTMNFIQKHDATGGGDEAVEVALTKAVQDYEWSENAVARLMFIVCDEPPSENDHTSQIHKAIQDASEKGIRIIPVVASAFGGSESSLEYLMRSAALATNGTYVFLTDQSGVGDKHADPVTDAYDVEYFNRLLPRLIEQFTRVSPCEGEIDNEMKNIHDTTTVQIIEHVVLDSALLAARMNNLAAENTLEDTLQPESISEQELNIPEDSVVYKSFSFYPNPTKGPITIDLNGNFQELFLADINGRLLERFDCACKTGIHIDIGKYPDGMYLLVYSSGEKTSSGKVLLLR
jgi:hypothetical protein